MKEVCDEIFYAWRRSLLAALTLIVTVGLRMPMPTDAGEPAECQHRRRWQVVSTRTGDPTSRSNGRNGRLVLLSRIYVRFAANALRCHGPDGLGSPMRLRSIVRYST